MKPARFIMNSDYAMVRIREHKELSISIPDYIEYSRPDPYDDAYTFAQVEYTKADPDDTVVVYFTSSRYNYAMVGRSGQTIPEGSSFTIIGEPSQGYSYSKAIGFFVRQVGNKIKFEAYCPSVGGGPGVSFRYQGYAQTITAHILSYKDPFSE